jgi:hypothetical protein
MESGKGGDVLFCECVLRVSVCVYIDLICEATGRPLQITIVVIKYKGKDILPVSYALFSNI